MQTYKWDRRQHWQQVQAQAERERNSVDTPSDPVPQRSRMLVKCQEIFCCKSGPNLPIVVDVNIYNKGIVRNLAEVMFPSVHHGAAKKPEKKKLWFWNSEVPCFCALMLPCLSVVGLAKLASNFTNMCKIHLDSGLQEQESFHPMVWIFSFLGGLKRLLIAFLWSPTEGLCSPFSWRTSRQPGSPPLECTKDSDL